MRYLNLIRHIRNWPAYFSYKLLGNKDGMVFQTRGGQEVNVPKRLMHTFKEVFFDDPYLRMNPLSDPQKAYTIVDIGANVGFFSLYCAEKYPNAKIHSVEPMPINHERLGSYTGSVSNVTVHHLAMSSSDGTIDLHFDASDSVTTAATVVGDGLGIVQPDKVTVNSRKMDTWCEENQIESIDLLKMDCEGSEYDVFYNLPEDWLTKVKNIAMEVHQVDDDRKNMEGLKEFLAGQGYEISSYRDILWASRKSS